MGAARTEKTQLGLRAAPLINKLQRVIRHVELHPPAGVTISNHGGKHHLSAHGYAAKHLWEWVDANELWTAGGYNWKDHHAVTNYLYRTVIAKTSFGRMAAWDLIEMWLPVFRAHLRELSATPVAEDDVDTHEVEERAEAREDAQELLTDLVSRHALGSIVNAELPRPLWSDDPEIDAMSKVKDALDNLENDARKRVLQYIADRYGLEFAVVKVSRA